MDVNVEEIQEHLEVFSLNVADDVLHKMKELCFVYKCNAEDIVDNWIAYSASKKLDMKPTLKFLDLMEKEELMKKEKSGKEHKMNTSITAPVYNSSTIDDIIIEDADKPDFGNKRNSFAKSPGAFSPSSASPACFTPSMKYGTRKGAGDVVLSFGNLQNVEWKHSDEYSCSIAPFNDRTVVKTAYHFMCEKLRDLASILNDMIQEAAEHYQEKYEIEEWGPIHLPSMESIPVIGRICSDNTGRLSASSLFLEGSQEMSSGAVIPIDVSHLEKFSLFPGQIVAGQGMNSTGKKLTINSIYDGIFPQYCDKVPSLPNCYDSLSVVVAAGPFTTSDSLSFEPLQDLLKYVKVHMPHVIILIGPFIDIKNEKIENNEFSEDYDELFQSVITDITNQLENLSTKVILVPSFRDVHHSCIYPTPPYRVKHMRKILYLASDPCILDIDGVLFGITATDILFHLGKEEISHPQLPDRLGRLCHHILTAKNFYPLYPCNEEINIDYLHYEQHASIPVMPHVLVLPSDLRYFAKDINGCCCLNPERLTKRVSGGTFARIKVKRMDGKNYTGSVVNSMQVEILKI